MRKEREKSTVWEKGSYGLVSPREYYGAAENMPYAGRHVRNAFYEDGKTKFATTSQVPAPADAARETDDKKNTCRNVE